MHCLLLLLTLCHATQDRPVMVLATIQEGALLADGITTAQFGKSLVEGDPVSKLLIGSHPTWARMAPIGAVELVATTYLAERMKTSRHKWERKTWWILQMLAISGHLGGFSINFAHTSK